MPRPRRLKDMADLFSFLDLIEIGELVDVYPAVKAAHEHIKDWTLANLLDEQWFIEAADLLETAAREMVDVTTTKVDDEFVERLVKHREYIIPIRTAIQDYIQWLKSD